MLPVETAIVDDVDEELAPAGVWTRLRDGERAPRIAVVREELVLDRVSSSAKPGALRVPALDHETRDHPVKDGPVVESFLHELAEVSGGDRHRVVEELALHVAHRRLKQDSAHAPPIRDSYVKDRAF